MGGRLLLGFINPLDPIRQALDPIQGIERGGMSPSGLLVKGLYIYTVDTFKGYIFFKPFARADAGFMAS